MAGSMREAIAAVAGQEFDELLGYVRRPRVHAPTDPRVKSAFEGFDYGQIEAISLKLARAYRCHKTHAEEAVHDRLYHFWIHRPELYRVDPASWMNLLYRAAEYRLIDLKAESMGDLSIEALTEVAGDAAFEGASEVVSPSSDGNEDCRYLATPRKGEAWTRLQMIGAVQRFRDHHGRPPKQIECKGLHRLPSPAVIRRQFGSFDELILESGMIPLRLGSRRKRWGALEAARACAAFRRRNGYWPGWAEVKRLPGDLPGTAAMLRFFGGTQPGIVQAGAEAILSDDDEPEAGVGARV